jgi:hypothetical protein
MKRNFDHIKNRKRDFEFYKKGVLLLCGAGKSKKLSKNRKIKGGNFLYH